MPDGLACVLITGMILMAFVAVNFIRHKWPRNDTPAE